MARPKKYGLDYFPLDVDFFSDEKMVCIYGEFGNKGHIVALHLLCAIYRNGYYVQWTEALLLKIAAATGLAAELVKMVVSSLVKWGFFDKSAFDSATVLTSAGIQRRYFSAARHKKFDCDLPYILAETRLNGISTEETPVSTEETPLNKIKLKNNSLAGVKKGATPAGAAPGSKVYPEEKGGEEAHVDITCAGAARHTPGDAGAAPARGWKAPEPGQVQDYFVRHPHGARLADAREAALRFFDYYEANGWVDGAGRRIVKWESRANIWIRDQIRIEQGQGTINPRLQNNGGFNDMRRGAARGGADTGGRECYEAGVRLVQGYLGPQAEDAGR